MTGRAISVLGIESSCDETAAAVVRLAPAGERCILSNVVLSQLDEHGPYGGVVPEIAARAHVEHMDGVVERAMTDAAIDFADLDAVAATAGPGLIGGVIVGLMTGKGISLTHGKPLIAVNHLEGHALSIRLLDQDADFPFLLLLISGGHCQVLIVEGIGRYTKLGGTIDDAVGEAFDKIAKFIGLGYPGGPAVEQAAARGDPARFDFPRPMRGRPCADFSFSGLKTAARQSFEALDTPGSEDVNDLCASFQSAVCDVLKDRCTNALTMYKDKIGSDGGRNLRFVVAGGVAANEAIRRTLEELSNDMGVRLIVPPPWLCTDNGAMIAWVGIERFQAGLIDGLNAVPRARWPLEGLTAGRSR